MNGSLDNFTIPEHLGGSTIQRNDGNSHQNYYDVTSFIKGLSIDMTKTDEQSKQYDSPEVRFNNSKLQETFDHSVNNNSKFEEGARCLDELAQEFRQDKRRLQVERNGLLDEREYEEAVTQVRNYAGGDNLLNNYFSDQSYLDGEEDLDVTQQIGRAHV